MLPNCGGIAGPAGCGAWPLTLVGISAGDGWASVLTPFGCGTGDVFDLGAGMELRAGTEVDTEVDLENGF